MMSLLLPTVLSVVLLADEGPKKDIDLIQGVWDVFSTEINGKPQPKNNLFRIQAIFDGNQLLTGVGKRPPEPRGTFKLDQGRKPKTYNLLTQGSTVFGIYVLDGDTLKICLSAPGDARPTNFATSPDDGRTVIIYKRLKKPENR
ncbi:TIGR03067 domain-containing protein [Singulisphaera sp. Ch08]|uniref:TIGR03067 domain-containing protein n=1 Tax=Singulisphaera sp. Ch08 TaxID=3120278 RepID=A0AAU7C9A2_9BACT